MANIKSIGGNPIVLGLDGLTDDAKAALGDSKLSAAAESLLGADSTAQWATRESTGTGSATVRSVQGASVVWNQLAPAYDSNDWTRLSSNVNLTRDDNGLTIRSATDTTAAKLAKAPNIPVAGHMYLLKAEIDASNMSETAAIFTIYSSSYTGVLSLTAQAGTQKASYSTIGTLPETDTSFTLGCRLANATPSGDYATFSNMQCFDLTQMFGSGNEPTTVAEFEAMYPLSYYPYSAPTLKPVQIAGIASTDAQGGELDAIEWPTQTLRAAGSVADMLYSDHVDTRVGVVDLGTLTWSATTTSTADKYRMVTTDIADVILRPSTNSGIAALSCVPYVAATNGDTYAPTDKTISVVRSSGSLVVYDSEYDTQDSAEAFKAAMQGVLLFYGLATPTTTPISPALPMTYKVQAGGSESIIVPDGEISAAPLITLAEGESAADVVMDALACIAAPDGPVATANHALGTYLTMGGKLYKVTSAIAVGETIVAGTNVTATTVMDEILALN